MDMRRDEKLYNSFEELTENVARALHNRNDAEMLFWVQTYHLLAQSKIAEKSDAIGMIMNRVTGSNRGCSVIYHMVEDQTEVYLQFEREYHISDVLDELGDHWKRMLCRPTIVYTRSFQAWLKGYVDECMPAINNMISELEAEFGGNTCNQLTEEDIKARQQAYRAYRTRLKNLIKKCDVAIEFNNIRR